MILYANGDSHTYGFSVNPGSPNFVNILAKQINYKEVNHATPGASNDKILRTTLDWLKNNTPDFVVIGWATWEREEWVINNKYHQISSSGTNLVPDEYKQKYKEWVVKQDSDMCDTKSRAVHERIYQLHQDLSAKKIPHLFFNAFENFIGIRELIKDWNNCFVEPYTLKFGYYYYLKNNGFKTVDNSYHYSDDGHQAWANFLIEYIKKYKLL